MLSILIPTYQFNILPLVKELHTQVSKCDILFEILVYDDASTNTFDSSNTSITKMSNCHFKKLNKNIGRSAIRNLLADDAQYDVLLFIDAGTLPKNKDFVEIYWEHRGAVITTGGMTHQSEPPKKTYRLRWLYTKNKEQNFLNNKQINSLFHSSNFLVQKWVLKKNPFDESLQGYGYEDVLFYNQLKKNNVAIDFINNPVIHIPDDNADSFLRKNENALHNLANLIDSDKLEEDAIKLSSFYFKLRKYGMHRLVLLGFLLLKPIFLLNLHSSRPSVLIFDLYRLGYFCAIKKTS